MPDGSKLPPSSTLRADPPADAAIARIFAAAGADGVPVALLGLVNRQIAQWQTNGMLAGWQAGADVPEPVAAALHDYLDATNALPAWADPARIARAEALFMDMSMLSCTLLFCASLPECYVMPELAGVLHVAGQLEEHCDYRVRSTAAMIFPVMLRGGLTAPAGGGVAQVLKVRLIHATIRHLILRASPEQALANGPVPALPQAGTPADAGVGTTAKRGLYESLYANGWDVARHGLPCNQQELAYTLLTFSYVFLRGLRTLGLGLPRADEEAYLHAWNVVGYVLGIEQGLMAHTMDEAGVRFSDLQLAAKRPSYEPDPRPELGKALMDAMRNEIPFRVLKPFPVLLTRHLCGKQAARALRLDGRVNIVSRALFVLVLGTARAIDTVVRLVLPEFSISRMVSRVLGYRFTARILMDQTRPLKLPDVLLHDVDSTLRTWHEDPKAPRWMNRLEAKMRGRRHA